MAGSSTVSAYTIRAHVHYSPRYVPTTLPYTLRQGRKPRITVGEEERCSVDGTLLGVVCCVPVASVVAGVWHKVWEGGTCVGLWDCGRRFAIWGRWCWGWLVRVTGVSRARVPFSEPQPPSPTTLRYSIINA